MNLSNISEYHIFFLANISIRIFLYFQYTLRNQHHFDDQENNHMFNHLSTT